MKLVPRSLTLIVALLIVTTACKQEKKPVRLYPALATVIPGDTKLLAGFQIEKLKKTPYWKRLIEARALPALERFATETGIDPRKDIYELVVAANGERDGTGMVIMASGRFATQRSFLGQSTKEMRPQTQIQGERMANIPFKGQVLIGNENSAMWFVNNATAFAGPTKALRRVIELREKSPLPPQALLDAIGTLPINDHFFFVSTLPIDQTLPEMNFGGTGRLKSIPLKLDRILGSGNLTNGFHLKARLESSDPKALDQLNSAVRGLIGIGRITTPADRQEMLRFYDGIQVNREAGAIKLEMDLPDDIVAGLLNNLTSSPGSRPRD